LSVVVYLNDSFIGGEIGFPQLDLKYAPQAGDALVFVADLVHEVFPVLDGDRYVFVTFCSVKSGR
jgi:hypothetical protein